MYSNGIKWEIQFSARGHAIEIEINGKSIFESEMNTFSDQNEIISDQN